ncbi:DUF2087 domain-containing protein [Actinoplanes sp. NPDC051633]|uniref:DUF2087 domain-containing protein n=1 Tax=Actinoplanes sp. NPDC051633 TaxID=3155670 RepID=UPI003411FFBB
MSVEAARAAEVLTALSSTTRLRVLADLARRGAEGATVAELAYPLDLPTSEVGTALARLAALGLASGSGNGIYRARLGELRDAAAAVDRLQPIAALLSEYPQLTGYFAHGRLSGMPPTMGERYELLGELLSRFLALDGLYQEDEINARLAEITDDVAGVRRMLVDTGWLERDRAGSVYGPGRQPVAR